MFRFRKVFLSSASQSSFLCGGSGVVPVSCFSVEVSVMFHFMFFNYTFGSVWVAELPPIGK